MVILDVVVLVVLIMFTLLLQGTYCHDLRQLETRMQKVETQAAYLIRQAGQGAEPSVPPSPYDPWLRASEDVDREINRARNRNRS